MQQSSPKQNKNIIHTGTVIDIIEDTASSTVNQVGMENEHFFNFQNFRPEKRAPAFPSLILRDQRLREIMPRRAIKGIFLLCIGFLSMWISFVLHCQRAVTRETYFTVAREQLELLVPERTASPPNSTNDIMNNSKTESFAACLLVMDDNHFLIEWLAYHYHVLPLRHLIVAVDPRSQTSPAEILSRWKDSINITVWWKDTDFIANAEELEEAESRIRVQFKADKPSAKLIRHRARQRLVYYHCMQEHMKANRTWTLFTDTDEFLTVNYDTVRARRTVNATDDEARVMQRVVAPPLSEPGSVLKLLQYEQQHRIANNIRLASPCIQIPRFRFGTVETDSAELQSDLPRALQQLPNFNASHLMTHRWRKHADPADFTLNRASKAIVDLSRVQWQEVEPTARIHLPVLRHCKPFKVRILARNQLLLIHHYLGTWEQYSYRDDSRAGRERSEKVSLVLYVQTVRRAFCLAWCGRGDEPSTVRGG